MVEEFLSHPIRVMLAGSIVVALIMTWRYFDRRGDHALQARREGDRHSEDRRL